MPLNIAETTFYEKINLSKLNHILNNYSKYEKTIQEHEKLMRRLDNHYDAYNVFEKMRANAIVPEEFEDTEFGYLKVSYDKGKASNEMGRWYAHHGIGLQPLCAPVRHTICEGIWIDIDQVNSHPTLLKQLFEKNGLSSDLLNQCLTDRENFLKRVMVECDCSRDDAKTRVIAVINGGGGSGSTLKDLKSEITPLIRTIIEKEEYANILEHTKKNYTENITGKTISRILQNIENDLLETYIEFFIQEGLMSQFEDGYEIALIFDGFQIIKNDEVDGEMLNKCRLYSREKTGYDVELKIKPFDNQLPLPKDYTEDCSDDVSKIVETYLTQASNYMKKHLHTIMRCIGSKGSHSDISKLMKDIIGSRVVYDDEACMWFHCNKYNVWNKRKKPIVLQDFIKVVLPELFSRHATQLAKRAEESTEDDVKKLLETKVKVAREVALKLKSSGFGKSVVEMAMVDFAKHKFYERLIDSKGHLLAFKDKVLDCHMKAVRNIRPDDYILKTTGYKYPDNIDESAKATIEEYYNTIYPDEETRAYMWNADSLILNGERPFQTFEIHTGSGCNSKSTKIVMLKNILGDYFVEMNAETFTRPPKSANSTSELAHAKGCRMVFFNEPESDTDNKLQVGLLKKMADGHKSSLKARGLYQEAVEFPIFFKVVGCCNNKPLLSSADGGIGRRVRVIDYPVKFVEHPDPNNVYQAPLNNDKVVKLTTDEIRDTMVRILIDRFINVSSELKTEAVPKKIKSDSSAYIEDSNQVLGYIMDKYVITGNENDQIPSNKLFTSFKEFTKDKMTASKFKDDMLNISGITCKRTKKGVMYSGLMMRSDDDDDA